jgi:DNA-binding NtrC family response regulator
MSSEPQHQHQQHHQQRALLTVPVGDQPVGPLPQGLCADWEVRTTRDLAAAHKALNSRHFTVGLLLMGRLREADFMAVDQLVMGHPATRWVGVLAAGLAQQADYRKLIVRQLFDFHTWPIDDAMLGHTLGHAHGFAELDGLKDAATDDTRDMALVGRSLPMMRLRRQIAKVAAVDAPVLIWGESGSGKELTAQAIHQHSARASGPFVAINCGGIPAGLIQSELFGHERGAFSGAVRDRPGLIESAAGGTLFLDEIGDLPLDMQTNLLRFLQEHTINRVGSTRDIKVDTRVVAASHRQLEEAVTAGRFREDLFYRLNVLPLTVPALRDRKDDLGLLVAHFFKLFAQDRSARLSGFSQGALGAIQAHDWPGNVRELINRVRRAMVMSDGRLITPEDLGLATPEAARDGDLLEEARLQAERQAIQSGLQRHAHNVTHAARELGVSRMTLYRLMRKHGIST